MLQKPKGTKDVLPEDIYKYQYIENSAFTLFESYGFKEIRVPTFEYTELFERGVGDTTDVVQKEMYTFLDKANRSITLRPEGTAGIVRAYIENGLSSRPSPFKVYYNMPMFRYENVQKGRYREFNQIGAEIIGASSYLADIELISMANEYLKTMKIENTYLVINSIGCSECRKKYQEALKDFIKNNISSYCDTCKTRFDKNPMRILDCKEEKCKKLNEGTPIILDYLCDDCRIHFKNVKDGLDKLNIRYEVDSNIVRGLDYYTKTVFEFISKDDGLTVLAGGRYDGLVKELGGMQTSAIGFAAGEERLVSLLKNDIVDVDYPDITVISMTSNQDIEALKLANKLRNYFIVETNTSGRSFNAQLKYANKLKSNFIIVLGEEEIKNRKCNIKYMTTGKQIEAKLDADDIMEKIFEVEDE